MLVTLRTTKKDLKISYVCGVNSGNFNFVKGAIPLCSSGQTVTQVHNMSGDCLGETSIELTVDNDVNNPDEAHNITKWEMTREYTEMLHTTDDEVLFNLTSNLFYIGHSHEHYTHGVFYTVASCSYNTDSTLDKVVNESITIVNGPPQIIFDQVNSSIETVDIVNNMILEYAEMVLRGRAELLTMTSFHFQCIG